MTSSGRKRTDSSEWSAAEAIDVEYVYRDETGYPTRTFRFVNDLDVEVTLDAAFTDIFDDSRSRTDGVPFYTETAVIGWPPIGGAPGGQTADDNITISAGAVETYAVPPSWDVIIFTIDPSSAPSTGTFDIINMK